MMRMLNKVEILTKTENPLQFMGKVAGICWNSDVSDKEKNISRAKKCINSGHGRILEYADVTFVIDGYSARCIRELYTHIQGVSRLQESTRYVDYSDSEYYKPPISNDSYDSTMEYIFDNYKKMIDKGVPKEDAANILPLGMKTKIVWKANLRALEHFMNMRLCSRAYKEIWELACTIKKLLSDLGCEEWKWISDNLFVPKCESIGYCQEEHCCGRKPKGIAGLKRQVIEEYNKAMENLK